MPPSRRDPWFARPRSLYATVFVWFACSGGRFLAPFLEHEAGLTDAQIGALLAMQTIAGMPFASWAGVLADRLESKHPGRGRPALVATGVLVGLAVFLLQGISEWSGASEDSFVSSASYYVLLRSIYSISSNFVLPVVDGMCHQYLGDSSEDYGKERLYGAITWAVANVIMSYALDVVGFKIMYPFSIASGLLVVLNLIGYAYVNQSRNYGPLEHRDSDEIVREEEAPIPEPIKNPREEYSAMELIRRVLLGPIEGDRSWYIGFAFVFAMVVMASGQVIVESLVFLYFEFLGSSFSMMGWTVVLTVIFEIPIFQVSSDLIKRFGPSALMLAAMACYVIRVIAYTLVPKGKIAFVLFIEPLHGITYACSAAAAFEFVGSAMPPGHEATGQGVASMARSMGGIAGLLLGGWAEDRFGPRTLYRSSASVVFSGFAVLLSASMLQRRRSSSATVISSVDEAELELTDRNEEVEIGSAEVS